MNDSTIGSKTYEISNRLSVLASWISEHDRNVKLYTAREVETRRRFEKCGDEFDRIMADNLRRVTDGYITKRQEAIDEWNSIISKATLQLKENA